MLGNIEKISDWKLYGLPDENTAYENMIIMDEIMPEKYPVLIDPQGQAFRFLKDYMSVKTDSSGAMQQDRVFLKASQSNATKLLQEALALGKMVFCENAGEVSSPALLSILRREVTKQYGQAYINFNEQDQPVLYEEDFRIYVFSHL